MALLCQALKPVFFLHRFWQLPLDTFVRMLSWKTRREIWRMWRGTARPWSPAWILGKPWQLNHGRHSVTVVSDWWISWKCSWGWNWMLNHARWLVTLMTPITLVTCCTTSYFGMHIQGPACEAMKTTMEELELQNTIMNRLVLGFVRLKKWAQLFCEAMPHSHTGRNTEQLFPEALKHAEANFFWPFEATFSICVASPGAVSKVVKDGLTW